MPNSFATTVKSTANSWAATSVHLITPNPVTARNKMRTITIKDIHPVEVLEGVELHFPHFNDEMPGDKRPIVNVYRYRFDNDFGVELSLLDKISSGHIRFLIYKKDSNLIKVAGEPSWGQRSVMRSIIKILAGSSEKNKNTAKEWKKNLEKETYYD